MIAFHWPSIWLKNGSIGMEWNEQNKPLNKNLLSIEDNSIGVNRLRDFFFFFFLLLSGFWIRSRIILNASMQIQTLVIDVHLNLRHCGSTRTRNIVMSKLVTAAAAAASSSSSCFPLSRFFLFGILFALVFLRLPSSSSPTWL